MISSLAKLLARAFAVQEGWEDPKSSQFPKKNPGNLMDLSYFKETGKYRAQQFSSWYAGWEACARLIQQRMLDKGLSLRLFLGGEKYAEDGSIDLKNGKLKQGGYPGYVPFGHGPNDPEKYAKLIGELTGLPIDTALTNAHLQNSRPSRRLPLYGQGPSGPAAA